MSRPNREHGARALAWALVLGLAGCSTPTSSTAELASPQPTRAPDDATVEPAPDRALDDATDSATEDAPPQPLAEPEDTPAPDAVAGLRPLTDAQRQTLAAGDEDPPIPVEIHYVQSNEKRHDLFFPYITGRGGAYVGVGSDQNFTLIGRARSELVFLMDIDYRVVGLHRIYGLLIPRAESPDALIEMFAEERRDATIAALEEGFRAQGLDDRAVRTLIGGYKAARETVYRHLKRVRDRAHDGAPTTWLSDPAMFKHIQTLHAQGRVRVMSGDLTGSSTLRTVAAACRALGVEVEVMYMSNAEEYFMYTPDFAQNIKGLPASADAVVVRTIYSRKWPHPPHALWAYQVQPLRDLQARLDDPRNRARKPMMRWAKNLGELNMDTGQKGLSLIALEPITPGAAPTDAAAPEATPTP
ncbi:MAG: hypothetical protein H6713_18240 [Myxococcales bacterium]|nr:hypothetical protein [Myxococcales bacterium]MCB9751918.1 hypothetical protein [Myxococcales bacterium]